MPDEKLSSASRRLDLILLTLAAGSADALGYLTLGKVFTSNMTGNVVLMGIALSEGRGNDTGRSLFALFAFIVGNCIGAWICGRTGTNAARSVTAAIGCESALLLVYAACSVLFSTEYLATLAYALIALLGLSMGLQAAAVFRLGTPGVTTTAITGTITNLSAGLMKIIGFLPSSSKDNHGKVSSFGLQSLVIATYCGGAAVSGLLILHIRPWAAFFPAAMAAATFIIRLLRHG